ncbi:1608_t:CDS:2 [Acaulospora morrowiae]|uniref:1608_t:CDS:1 n=1 Tax=Acaulospora morrowiae TaxID=94023 RepID=A0A9N8W088_9GLOM|nr:1608_t:CDS:2 [Acaulospora morrowiae]
MNFETILARPVNILSLPTATLSTLASRKVDSLPQLNLDQNKNDVTNEREPLRPTCLACGISSFDTVEQQRAHFALDWHRFNVKRRSMNINAGKTIYVPVTEQEFEEFTGDALSSISGSETSESDSSSQSENIATLAEEFELHNIHGKEVSVKGGARNSVPILWFTSSNILLDGIYLGVYKNILYSKGDNQDNPIENIEKLQAKSKGQPRYWTMIMIGGGHFAGLVLDIASNSRVTNPKEVKVVVYKTFHRYTTRRKQGGSQANSDNAKGKAKSAGATIRRYNEAALQNDIRLLLDQWKPMIDQSEIVFVRATSVNKKILYNYDEAVLKKDDPRIRSFPFSTRRPTFNELKRCFIELTTVKISQMTEEALQNHEKKSENIQRSIKDKPPLDGKGEETIRTAETIKFDPAVSDVILKLISLTKQGKLELLKNHISKHSLNALNLLPNTSVSENDISKTPTLLHLSSFTGHGDIVEYLLTQNADPTILSSKNMTPYDLAKDKETRNVFRRHMANNPNQWDWSSAHQNQQDSETNSESVTAKLAAKSNPSSKSEKLLGGATDSLLARLGMNTCAMCKKSLSGLVPFEKMNLKFCSTTCVKNHRELQE